MAAQCVTKVELTIACTNLLDKDVGSKSDPLCVLLQNTSGQQWYEVDRTERIKNSLNPKFSKKFLIDYYFELVQKLKFGIYDIDNKTFDLSDDDFLGEFECTLGQIVSSKTITKPLVLKNGRPAGRGSITITAEEVKDNRVVVFEVEARKLDNKDFFGKSDPYLEFHKQTGDGNWVMVHRTEVIKNNLNPVWRPFKISLNSLCYSDMDKSIKSLKPFCAENVSLSTRARMPSSARENLYAVLPHGSLVLSCVQESIHGTKEMFLSCLDKVLKIGLDRSNISSKANLNPFKKK